MIRKFMAILFFAILFGTGCSGGSNSATMSAAPDFSKLTPACFAPYASNPILTRDSLFAGSDWNDPSVIKVGNQYVMYASSDHSFDMNIAIYRMVSSDGLNWSLSPVTPVFAADQNVATWDHRATETPSVVYFNGQYHMFYTGYPVNYADGYSYKIGHATSLDGINWTRDPNNPIVAPNAPYDPLNPTQPNPIPNMTFDQ